MREQIKMMREQIKMMRDEGCTGCVLAKKKTFFCGLDPVSSRSCVNTDRERKRNNLLLVNLTCST